MKQNTNASRESPPGAMLREAGDSSLNTPGRTASILTAHSNDKLIVEATDLRHVSRLAALEYELRLNVATTGTWQPPSSRWYNARVRRAPGAIIKKTRASRYRMPRQLKGKLIHQLVTANSDTLELPTAMVIVAHQDDESVGAGSRLCTLTDAYVVHVTDGAPRNPAVAQRYGFTTREEYAEARREELARAMEVAGVPLDHVINLGYVDGEASVQMVDLVMDVATLIDDYAPDIVITHPYEGGHTDHDATAFAVHLACGLLHREGVRTPAVLEMTSYHAMNEVRVTHEFLPHAGADKGQRQVVLSREEQQLKKKMYAAFETQQAVLSTFSTTIEKFRPAPRYVFTRAPHGGKLNYERYGDPELGARWRATAEEALNKLRMRAA